MAMNVKIVRGSNAPNGVTLAELRTGGISVDVQPDSGMDITAIRGAKREFLTRAAGNCDRSYVRESLGTLREALSVLPAWNSTPLPGYDSLTGLHAGLSGLAPIDESFLFESPRGAEIVTATYDLSGAAITGNAFSIAALLERSVSLFPSGGGEPVALKRTDTMIAKRKCLAGFLDHPNTILLPGDRVLYNPKCLVKVAGKPCIFDRDGKTPSGLNILQGVGRKVFDKALPERCLLSYMRCSDNGPIPAMLLSKSGTSGIGIIHEPDRAKGSFMMVWISPMGPEPGQGVCSIEFATTLPLGVTRNSELKMMVELGKNEQMIRETTLYFLESKKDVDWFVKKYGIETDPSYYSKEITQDTPSFDRLRHAAGIKF